jgi:hypothetical protein
MSSEKLRVALSSSSRVYKVVGWFSYEWGIFPNASISPDPSPVQNRHNIQRNDKRNKRKSVPKTADVTPVKVPHGINFQSIVEFKENANQLNSV